MCTDTFTVSSVYPNAIFQIHRYVSTPDVNTVHVHLRMNARYAGMFDYTPIHAS